MKITFITNYMTHHQLPFANALYGLIGDDFTFIETNNMDEERMNMGWSIDKSKYPYIHSFENSIYDEIIEQGEVVILGGTHQVYLGKRLDNKKLTFRYYERLYKTGQLKAYIPSSYKRNVIEHTNRKEDPVYLLCAGAYVASDFSIFGAYPEKMLKWGYFPEFEEQDVDKLLEEKDCKEILWTGRMIDWKQPLMPLKAMNILKKQGVEAHLTMIGDGPYRSKVEEYIISHNLSDSVKVLDFMSPENVREYMKKSLVYLMTSNMQEGWGAVVNEAMNCGCAVVASYGAGSVPYLINDGTNGIVFDYKSHKSLATCIKKLLEDVQMAKVLGSEAYKTISNEWNPGEAADRFVKLCRNLLEGNLVMEDNGPLSKAYNIKPSKGFKLCKDGGWR